jgi:hypothetical protein
VSAQAHRQELIQDLFKVWQDPQRGTVTGGMIKYELYCDNETFVSQYLSFAIYIDFLVFPYASINLVFF